MIENLPPTQRNKGQNHVLAKTQKFTLAPFCPFPHQLGPQDSDMGSAPDQKISEMHLIAPG